MMFLYSNVVGILKQMREMNLFRFQVDSSRLTPKRVTELAHSDDPISLLSEYQMEDELRKSVVVGVAPALISEFCSSHFEVMHLAMRGKMSIALQLLRKQLQETLLHMEWLVVDPIDYADRFNSGDPKQILPFNRFDTPDKRKDAIRQTQGEIMSVMTAPSMTAETLHLLRYEKNASGGFYRPTQQAIHLLTTMYKEIATEPYNLNLIFSDNVALESQQDHIYRTLPYLCDYFRQVAIVLLDKISEFDKTGQTWLLDEVRRLAGLDLIGGESETELTSTKTVSKVINECGSSCPSCEGAFSPEDILDRRELQMFMYHGEVPCRTCNIQFWIYDTEAPQVSV